MKSDFAKEVFVQVLDRKHDEPILSVVSDVDELSEDAETAEVGVYSLIAVRKLTVTRKLQ